MQAVIKRTTKTLRQLKKYKWRFLQNKKAKYYRRARGEWEAEIGKHEELLARYKQQLAQHKREVGYRGWYIEPAIAAAPTPSRLGTYTTPPGAAAYGKTPQDIIERVVSGKREQVNMKDGEYHQHKKD